MDTVNPMNVFHGETSLIDFYTPDKGPPIPLVELPQRLNPFRKDGVRIYAKLMSHVPAANIKSLPALNMILRAQEAGEISNETHTLVEYSSGSTVTSIGIVAHILGIPKVKAYVTNKTTEVKLQLLRFFGLDVLVHRTFDTFRRTRHPVHSDPNGGIFVAAEEGKREPGVVNPDQYFNRTNWESHMRWTGPQIYAQLPEIKVSSTAWGRPKCSIFQVQGTITGTGIYLKSKVENLVSIGVATAPEDRVPGPRSLNVLLDIEFPWREGHDVIEEVGSFEAYEKSMELSRFGLLVGPSSGLALVGVFNFLAKRKENGTLDELRNSNGEIPCVFICADQPFQYIGDYFKKLPSSHFCPVTNEELFTSDRYPYNMDWEVTPEKGQQMLTDNGGPAVCVLDLRNEDDFNASHITGSLNADVGARDLPNPYKHAATLTDLFQKLDSRLSAEDATFGAALKGRRVLTVSYDGNVARLAMSILRNRGLEAYCVQGGYEGGYLERKCRRGRLDGGC
ncbi:tryptophan synthase beta subunit-like PLP-dependent enzyme [Mycena metata]|uniref:Tryptophan synthase beta subunit-like PLP-dependent enzyme n=1 Tax=Mycena metata TaxID=1033252 RepID=A0AAD7JTI6_9AGAR|nr:tryptophan synthase beta subunit-like PLP-dependent enzyme [Mycena metata]